MFAIGSKSIFLDIAPQITRELLPIHSGLDCVDTFDSPLVMIGVNLISLGGRLFSCQATFWGRLVLLAISCQSRAWFNWWGRLVLVFNSRVILF